MLLQLKRNFYFQLMMHMHRFCLFIGIYLRFFIGLEFNFKKQSNANTDSLGTPYDYRSMMHYTWNAFGKDQKMTIKTLDPSQQYEIGQDEGFSHIDILQINKLYNCSKL